jgi:nucleoside-diphosphate-sugar epimerase
MVKMQQVVLGAGGGLGSAIVRALAARGAAVRAVVRRGGATPTGNGPALLDEADAVRRVTDAPDAAPPPVELLADVPRVVADVSTAHGALAACDGADIVYLCVNVPYDRWTAVMPKTVHHVLAAVRGRGVRLVFPGNVYGYGPLLECPAREDHPRGARGPKGRLRNDIEQTLLAAHAGGAVRVVIPRMPDFYGPGVTNELYGGVFRAALRGRRALWLGRRDQPHDLLFVEDAARACVALAECEEAYGQSWHVPGAGPLTGQALVEQVCAAAGQPARLQVAGRLVLRLLGLFNPVVRELPELLWQYEQPLELDGRRFAAAFPEFRYTPHAEAIRRTLAWFAAVEGAGA